MKKKKDFSREPFDTTKKKTVKIIPIVICIIIGLLAMFCIYFFLILSSDNSLKELKITEHSIKFNSKKYSYDLEVPNGTKKLEVKAIANDKNAKIKISKTTLQEGNNNIKVTVISQNGFKKDYVINVYRKKIKLECEESYSLKNNKCEKKEYVNEAKLAYSCPEGGELNKKECNVYDTKAPFVKYSCKKDYTLNQDTCTKRSTTSATLAYSCPSGYQVSGSKCIKSATLPATIKYTCSNSNATLYGNQCVVVTTTSAQKVNGRYMCVYSGCSLYGSYCECRTTYSAKATYSCSSGYKYNGYNCVSTIETNSTQYYKCPIGYTLKDTTCYKQESMPATASLTCPTGYSKSSNNICKKLTKKYDATNTYTCEENLVLEETKCYKVLTKEVNKIEY